MKVLLHLCLCLCSLPVSSLDAAPPRPNLILFLADDLGYGDLGCYGHPMIQTPNLDAFAKQGVRLTQCYAASAVCSPSRSALLTGRTPHRNGVFTWIAQGSEVHLRTNEIALPALLKTAGYTTCHIGKWHLNGRFNQPAQPQPGDHGYDWWMATQNNAAPSHENPVNFVRNGQPVGPMQGYSAPLVAAEAIAWLREKRDFAKPFFLAVWTHEPHYPIKSDPKFKALYPGLADDVQREHHANVTQMDHAFGQVMKALDDLKLADSTFVFFTSDNGPEGDGVKTPGRGSTGGLRGRKRDLHEGGIRVPGLARWPGRIKPGTTCEAPVVGSDLFPTLLALAGVEPPKDRVLDGVNVLAPLIGTPAKLERLQPLYWRLHMAPNMKIAMRVDDWKILANAELTEFELYNLENDPQETTDLKAKEAERFAALRDRLAKHNAAIDAEGPDWWKRLDPNGARAPSADGSAKKQIVLIAGFKSHGPEGNRIHDYPWSVRLLKTTLEHSNIRDRVDVQTFFNGWPDDPAVLEGADTIMIVSDGRDGPAGREAPHLSTPERVRQVDRLMKRGCGIIAFHFSTFAPDALADRVLDWYGGYFDWETDGKRQWYSKIQTLEAEVTPAAPGHPVLNGTSPFRLREEFYFDIRFGPDDPRWKPIWRVDVLPAATPNGKVVAWAVERADGGRGFATTCGHFYDNWMNADFRKTLCNAIAWTAKIDVPDQGVESEYFERPRIQAHLAGGKIVSAEEIETADNTTYAEKPYWYKPGHPLNPAESSSIQTLPGFKAERVLAVPAEYGSFTALAVDPKGRLLASAQHEAGIYRIEPTSAGDAGAQARVEKLGGAAASMGWSHGLLHAFDSLYVTVSERNDSAKTGLHRLRDTDGDDQFDTAELLFELKAAGEHGPHNLVAGPDGKTLYMMCGNGTPLPEGVGKRRPVRTEGVDHLLPPGFETSKYTAAGWVLRFDPDGSHPELIGSGLRNSFDLAFNRAGDLFTFDSDMEWDLGTPWYRPTRICQVVSGAEFGWRDSPAVWPEHFEDSVAPVVNIGPASPTGIVFGYGAKFPAKYQHALYACDWTFGTIHAVHLRPEGAAYRAEVEEFVGGNGLPVTDTVIGADGALYFVVGGRRLGSAVYRVRYTGGEDQTQSNTLSEPSAAAQGLHRLRRELETWHGRREEGAIKAAWPHLGHGDRAIRFAARVAVESQSLDQWRDLALRETHPDSALTALLALARQGSAADQKHVLDHLSSLPWDRFSNEQKLRTLRVYELALARGKDAVEDLRPAVTRRIRPWLPDGDGQVNRELSRLLCFLGDASAIEPLLDLMDADTGERPQLGSGYFVRNPKYGAAVRAILESAPLVERMHHAQMLLWLDDPWTPTQRRRYFKSMADALAHSKGGHQYRDLWSRIREVALRQVPEGQRQELEALEAQTAPLLAEGLPSPAGPGKDWTLEEALQAAEQGLDGRDLVNGRKMYAAAGCVVCHQFNGEGGAIGPDLSTIGRRFTLRDILDAIIHPSKAISDQYQMTTLELAGGKSLSGRIVSLDSHRTRIATNLMRPTQSVEVDNTSIRRVRTEPVSTMPSSLLNPLSRDELLDLLAYLTK